MWHTQWDPSNTPLAHIVTIDMQKPYLVKGLIYLPRQDGHSNGYFGQFSVEANTDGKIWPAPVASGTWPSDATLEAASQARASAQAAAQAQAAKKALEKQAAARGVAAQEASSRARASQAEAIAQAMVRAHAVQEAAASPFIGFIDAATYGPRDVTPRVKELHMQWISETANLGKPVSFTIGNDTLKGDPTPGMAKSCAVLYRRCHKNDPVNTCKALTLFAAENQPITYDPNAFDDSAADHEADFRTAALLRGGHVVGAVEMATYDPKDVTAIVQDLFAYGVASPELAAAASRQADAAAHMRSMLARGLAVRETGAPFAFTVANDVFMGDPAPGSPKSCEVLFRKYEAGSPVATSAYVVLKAPEGARIVFA
ncbi:hypothetical protein MMC26_006754 [Xylographa opegraphella]|nr:hypothetical protein [Xylographa opegraphella]